MINQERKLLKVYNTLSKKKEEFRSIEKNKVKMYVCGPTVYDDCHIGHARSLIAFDTIRRYLEFLGYNVIYVQNFTDVDDKMINRANEQNREIYELAEEYITRYFEDTKPLNIKRATYHPRATAVINKMIEIIKILLEKGYAYNINGNLYFNIMKFPSYGELAGFKVDEEEGGVSVACKIYLGEKKDRKDFALWKKKKEGEPSWWSPWGGGRPGWHIECSTMSIKYLGNKIDIHGGGQDLIFPHHQNEIAQSEAYSGEKPFVRYWLHNGFVNIESEKMSKSLGNFITIRAALEKYPAEAIRFLLVSTHYRKPIDFSEDQVESSIRTLDKIYIALDFLEQFLRGNTNINSQITENSLKKEEIDLLEEVKKDFIDSMNDDFDTHGAIVPLMKLVKYINGNMETPESFSKKFISKSFELLINLGEILGLFLEYKNPSKERQNTLTLIDNLINIRDEARQEKNYKLADKIRDNIKDIGYIIKDFKSFSLVQRLHE